MNDTVFSQRDKDILYSALAKFHVYDDIKSEILSLLESLKPKSDRFFTRCDGFPDTTRAICIKANGSSYLIDRNGSRYESNGYWLEECLDFVFEGVWQEITEEEAKHGHSIS